jgi:hypothetical protein
MQLLGITLQLLIIIIIIIFIEDTHITNVFFSGVLHIQSLQNNINIIITVQRYVDIKTLMKPNNY